MSLQNFQILNSLGEGSFATVFRVKRKSDNKIYALKKAKFRGLSLKQKENALNEVRILASLTHENIVQYKQAFFDHGGEILCIVMDFASQGDLMKKVNKLKSSNSNFTQNEIWRALVQITKGLQALHQLRILHRDLKCANIFISQDGYQLGDLNVSKINKTGLVYTQTGTPYYASPQVWKDQPYTYSSDIWSLGCVLYEMAAKQPPFTASNMRGLYQKVVRGIYPPIPHIYSNDLSNVIRSMLQVNPDMRPSCQKILEMPPVLRHIQVDPIQRCNSALLGTICISPNVKATRLPAAKYEQDLEKQRMDFFIRDIQSAAHLRKKNGVTQSLESIQEEKKRESVKKPNGLPYNLDCRRLGSNRPEVSRNQQRDLFSRPSNEQSGRRGLADRYYRQPSKEILNNYKPPVARRMPSMMENCPYQVPLTPGQRQVKQYSPVSRARW